MGDIKLGLKVGSGKQAGTVFSLNKSKFIGSQPDCEIHLTEWGVEPVHARIKFKNDGCMIVNLAETVMLTVNGVEVRAIKLNPGDLIDIGEVLLQVVDLSAPPVAAVSSSATLVESAEHVTASYPTPIRVRPSGDGSSVLNKGRLFIYAALGMLIVMVSFITVRELMDRKHQKEMLNAAYSDALEYSQTHPDDCEKAVAKYGAVLAMSSGQDRRLEEFVRQEISRLEMERAARQSQYAVLLDTLDRKSGDLAARNAYSDAEAVYRECDQKFRSRVLQDRQVQISEIRRLAVVYSEKVAEDNARVEAGKKAAQEQVLKKDLDKALGDVVDLMIKGQVSTAEKELHRLVAESKFEKFRPALDTALTTVELLGSIDRVQKMAVDLKPESAPEVTVDCDTNVSPVVGAVLALRRGETNSAVEIIQKDETHILAQVIRGYVSTRRGVPEILTVWNIHSGDKLSGLPTPEELVIFLNRKALEIKDADLDRLCKGLLAFKEKCNDKELIARHAALFDTAHKLLAQMKDGNVRTPAQTE